MHRGLQGLHRALQRRNRGDEITSVRHPRSGKKVAGTEASTACDGGVLIVGRSPPAPVMHAAQAQRMVLVVDDDRDARTVLTDFLSFHGHLVECAASGREALRKLTHGELHPDVIVADLAMPDLDGSSLIEVLNSEARFSSIPVVIVSAFCEAEAPSPRGARARFLKPVDLEVLVEELARI
jgi:CheY-like chemotaxis protein